MAGEHHSLRMRCNRLMGAALVEHNLIRVEHLENANERLLELVNSTDNEHHASILSILLNERKDLKEEDLLHYMVEEAGISLIDLSSYDVPDEFKKNIDLGTCWATWSAPFDQEENFYFVATAYYLSVAARTFWEKQLKGQI